MNTHDSLRVIFQHAGRNDLFVSSLGRTAEEAYIQSDNIDRILFLDCMGSVSGVSMGVALACRSVNVYGLDTDGSFMYDLSIFHSIASESHNLLNFTLLILDNEKLESAGGCPSRLVQLDWTQLASAWGLDLVVISCIDDLAKFMDKILVERKCRVAIIKITNFDPISVCSKNIDGIESKYRFKRFINDNINGGIICPSIKN